MKDKSFNHHSVPWTLYRNTLLTIHVRPNIESIFREIPNISAPEPLLLLYRRLSVNTREHITGLVVRPVYIATSVVPAVGFASVFGVGTFMLVHAFQHPDTGYHSNGFG